MSKYLKILCAVLVAVFALQVFAVADAAAPKKRTRPKEDRPKPARFARVAILPVINLQEDIEYANTIVFQKALELFRYPDYEIYDSDSLYKALEEVDYYEAGKKGKGISEEMLRTIMQKAGLDMIVAVRLDKLTQETYPYGKEDRDQLTIDLHIMAIYEWRDKIVDVHIKDKKTEEYGAIMKIDWKLQEYGRYIDIYLDRIADRGIDK